MYRVVAFSGNTLAESRDCRSMAAVGGVLAHMYDDYDSVHVRDMERGVVIIRMSKNGV